ncbi:unnamed protein product [Pleuronectes platessa]|uniref:Uncharacterized protein n=1 Tax=Pleuronectes platessa TaxID=8262 RepID=A0A9N7YBT2_PLEPL|nr:unnamed protein product [Pleuronectes platessa]
MSAFTAGTFRSRGVLQLHLMNEETSPSSSPSLSAFPGIPLLYRPQIQGLCCRTMDYDLWIAHQRSQWWIQYGGFYILRADRSGNGGSCVALASDNGGGPGPSRRLMVDPNKRQWTMTVDYSGSDLDDGS